jgi:hypothetical protein
MKRRALKRRYGRAKGALVWRRCKGKLHEGIGRRLFCGKCGAEHFGDNDEPGKRCTAHWWVRKGTK